MSLIHRQKLWNFFECLFKNELTSSSQEIEQPSWIETPLLPHQRTSVHAALQTEAAKEGLHTSALPGEPCGGTLYANYGILGDRVGSGKSLIALSLLKYPPPSLRHVEYSWRPNTYFDTNVGLLRSFEPTDLSAVSTALFIMPHAIIGQWEDYVREDTTLRCYFIKKRKDAVEDLVKRLGEYDAVFVSATMWREFESIPTIQGIFWGRIFIDEADTIMFSASSADLKARFIWLISASWMNLVFSGGAYFNLEYNSVPESASSYTMKRIGRYISNNYLNIGGIRSPVIKKLCGNVAISGHNISMLNPVLFQATRLLIHNSDEFIARSFEIPDIQHIHYLCLTPPNIQILRSIVSDDIMERLHAGDSEGVLDVLGMQAKTADQIVAAVTESVQHELDQVRRTYEFKKTMDYVSDAAKTKSLAQYADRLTRLESRIHAIEDRLKHSTEQSCPICFDSVQTPSLTPCCRNLFCLRCICEVLRRASICPLCRETIPSVQALQIVGNAAPEVDDKEEEEVEAKAKHRLLTKQEQLRNFLKNTPEARVLLFSVYDATFSGLERMLEMEGISFATLGGSQARIAKLLRQFADGKYRILFLNARNMGAGLNIASATHVVLYHKMAVETKNQIIGRAIRMGRTEPLTVLHLLHGNEMLVREEEGLTTGNRIQHM